MAETIKLGSRQLSIGTCDQGTKNDCGIWVITNAFMREITLLLGWITPDNDQYINWELENDDNCSKYKNNDDKYKYCVLYTFFQIFLRKNFGSCGLDGESSIRAFCNVFNKLIHEEITLITLINMNIIDVIVDTAQQVEFISQLKGIIHELDKPTKKIFTEDIQIDIKKRNIDELYEAQIRYNELTRDYPYIDTVLEVLNEIREELDKKGKQFDVESYVINDFVKSEDGSLVKSQDGSLEIKCNLSENVESGKSLFDKLKSYFDKGQYAVGALEFGPSFDSKFKSIRQDNPENNSIYILNRIRTLLQERDNQKINNNHLLDEAISEYLYLPSGLINSNPNEDPITMFDTFSSIIYEPDTEINLGHAVIIKNIFKWEFEGDNLGEYYYDMKNTWRNTWGIDGCDIFPVKMNPFIAVFIFTLVPKSYGALKLSSQKDSYKDRIQLTSIPDCALDVYNPEIISKIPDKNPIRPTIHKGGKRRNRTRKKRRKITCKKYYRKKPVKKTNRKKRK